MRKSLSFTTFTTLKSCIGFSDMILGLERCMTDPMVFLLA